MTYSPIVCFQENGTKNGYRDNKTFETPPIFSFFKNEKLLSQTSHLQTNVHPLIGLL